MDLKSSSSPPPVDPPKGSATPEALLAASIENWKRKLLDLSKRNRALNFRPSRVATITIVDEQPAEVFRQLYLREKPMRFKAAPEKAEAAQVTATQEAEIPPQEEDNALALDFVPYDASSLEIGRASCRERV